MGITGKGTRAGGIVISGFCHTLIFQMEYSQFFHVYMTFYVFCYSKRLILCYMMVESAN